MGKRKRRQRKGVKEIPFQVHRRKGQQRRGAAALRLSERRTLFLVAICSLSVFRQYLTWAEHKEH